MYENSSTPRLCIDECGNGNQKLGIEIVTSASETVVLQLEDKNLSSPVNYTSGRFSCCNIDLQSSSTCK